MKHNIRYYVSLHTYILCSLVSLIQGSFEYLVSIIYLGCNILFQYIVLYFKLLLFDGTSNDLKKIVSNSAFCTILPWLVSRETKQV